MTYLPNFRQDGRTVLLTGASKGLGLHMAHAFAEAGANLVLVSRNGGALEDVASPIRAGGTKVTTFPVDLASPEGPARLLEKVEEAGLGIDVLINNAGTNIQQSTLDITREAWNRIMDINLHGAFFTAQAVARHMASRSGGRIINLSSQMGEVGFYKRAAYCASKSAMLGFTRAMAIELAPLNIRVNALGPTFIDSPLAREMFKDEDVAREVMQRIPIGRLGKMEEVAAAAVFLASDGADLITGHHLLADGGWTAW